VKKLFGRTGIEDALGRLDRLTQDEVRMAAAQGLKATHEIDDKVQAIEGTVHAVDDKVKGVESKLQGVDDKVQGVDDKVQGVDDRVRDVDDKIDLVIDGV
jgi:archaellum component FlaC